jgi:hypothetical protein
LTQPNVRFLQDERTWIVEAVAVSFDDGAADLGVGDGGGALRQHGAGHEPHQIERVGHLGGVVEIADAPHQAAVGVTPAAEILQVSIADREHRRSIGEVGTYFQDGLRPAPISCPQKLERSLRHVLALLAQIPLHHLAGEPRSQPAVVCLTRLCDGLHDDFQWLSRGRLFSATR